jgi:nucleotide-binding universal stress UspA family protein
MFKHILVPTDGSELSRMAANQAVELAKVIGARVTLLHALPEIPPTFFGGEGTLIDQTSPEEITSEAKARASNYLGDLEAIAKAAGVACEKVVSTPGAPYEAIIEAATARGCDLILMASHGRRGIKGLVLGSETQKVLTHSKIPVLVYR